MSKDKPRRESKTPKRAKAPAVATKGPLTAPPVPNTARRGK